MSKVILCNDHANPLVFEGLIAARDQTEKVGYPDKAWRQYEIYKINDAQFAVNICGKSENSKHVDKHESFFIDRLEREAVKNSAGEVIAHKVAGWFIRAVEGNADQCAAINPKIHGKLLYQLALLGIDELRPHKWRDTYYSS